MGASHPGSTGPQGRVWDLPTRLFHWSLLVLVVVLWATGEFGGFDVSASIPGFGDVYLANMDIHGMAGQGVLVLVIFRVLWGLWGSTTAQFRHFVRGPGAVSAEVRAVLKGRDRDIFGHNPLGALMVVALLLVLLVQSATGLFSADDFFYEGPLAHLVSEELSENLTDIHHIGFSLLQVLVGVHIAAILAYLIRGRNLVRPMVTGRKSAQAPDNVRFSSGWLALVSLLMAIAALLLLRSL